LERLEQLNVTGEKMNLNRLNATIEKINASGVSNPKLTTQQYIDMISPIIENCVIGIMNKAMVKDDVKIVENLAQTILRLRKELDE
jgi:hypothetical protein